jgi:hypothetical protein
MKRHVCSECGFDTDCLADGALRDSAEAFLAAVQHEAEGEVHRFHSSGHTPEYFAALGELRAAVVRVEEEERCG